MLTEKKSSFAASQPQIQAHTDTNINMQCPLNGLDHNFPSLTHEDGIITQTKKLSTFTIHTTIKKMNSYVWHQTNRATLTSPSSR